MNGGRIGWAGLGLLVGLAGCQSTPSPFPMAADQSLPFRFTVPPVERTITIRTEAGPTVVNGTSITWRAAEGLSQFFWRNGDLFAIQMSDTRFSPPLPLYTPPPANREAPAKRVPYRGVLRLLGRSVTAEGTLEMASSPERIQVDDVSYRAMVSTIELRAGADQLRIRSWFATGTGLVRQTMHRNGRLEYELARLVREPEPVLPAGNLPP